MQSINLGIFFSNQFWHISTLLYKMVLNLAGRSMGYFRVRSQLVASKGS